MEEESEIETTIQEEEKPKKKNRKGRIISLVLALTIGGAAATGAYVFTKNELAKKEARDNANELVSLYMIDSESCIIDDSSITTSNAYDYEYCDGQTLYDAIVDNGIKYCEILDEYYTADGKQIAIVTADVTYSQKITPTTQTVDGKKISILPSGYTRKDDAGYKEETKTFVKICPVKADGNYEDTEFEIPEGNEIVSVSVTDVEIVNTSKFSDIISQDLIIDVPDNAVAVEGSYEASLKLIKK